MTTLHLKTATYEIEYDGELSELTNTLPALVETMGLVAGEPLTITTDDYTPNDQDMNLIQPVNNAATPTLSVSTIAARLSVSSGPELIIAAAASLSIFQKRNSFSRQELLREMQAAHSYYKKTYSSNLSKALTRLVKSGDLLEQSGSRYSLSATKLTELESRLA